MYMSFSQNDKLVNLNLLKNMICSNFSRVEINNKLW
jgi:hypothetical protein